MIFRESFRRGLARGLAGWLLFVAGSGLAQARDESSVWSIKGAHNTVYLAGSVHALPPEHAGFSPQLERAYAASKVIVMEVDLDDLDPLEAVQFVTSNGTLPADQDLEGVMGAERYAPVAKLAASLDLPELVIARLEPWAAAMVLTQFALVKSGFDPQLGIDMQLTERARTDGKRIDGLETVIDQLSIFDSRSLEEQSKFLVDSANDVPKMHEDLDRLVSAWRSGDMRGLEKEFIKERAQAPALYDELLGKRNRKWLPHIEALLDEDQDYLVVVGTLHFVGRDGLLELLTRAGHKPLPLPAAPGSR
ncbi:MAG: TraB/GumN family protein [Pseudomonadota bacterium]